MASPAMTYADIDLVLLVRVHDCGGEECGVADRK